MHSLLVMYSLLSKRLTAICHRGYTSSASGAFGAASGSGGLLRNIVCGPSPGSPSHGSGLDDTYRT